MVANPLGGFGGMVVKNWTERERSTEELFGEVYGAVSQVPGLRVFPRLDPPLPTPGQFDVEMIVQSDGALEQLLETTQAVLNAGMQSGKFMYVDNDPEDRPAAGPWLGARPRATGRSRPRPGDRRARARHAARRRVRQPLQLLRSQLQGHSADRR